jgi:two-component system OmpR family sensor kinase
MKHTPSGGSIHVSLSHSDGEAVLIVTDTGAGFEPEEANGLFDRFYRSDATAVQAEAGNGLGIAIAKAMVERYGGSVHAREGPGLGATFEVRLPCQLCGL